MNNTTASLLDGVPSREVPGRTAPSRRGRAFLIIPLVLVNLAAIWGQAGWALTNLHHGMIVAVLFALAVESIGCYLAWEAHEALMADQGSGLLRLGSYGVGLLAGTLNYLHFLPEGLSTALAFGALSSISPWLWAIWSRARNRNRLAELGMVDVRAVKLGTARKLFHPVKSLKVVSWAAWEGITDPAGAVAGWEWRARPELSPEPPPSSSAPVPEPATTYGTTQEMFRALDRAQDYKSRILDLAETSEMSKAEIARLVGCSDRHVRKVLAEAA